MPNSFGIAQLAKYFKFDRINFGLNKSMPIKSHFAFWIKYDFNVSIFFLENEEELCIFVL
jgi:hypothetical protein